MKKRTERRREIHLFYHTAHERPVSGVTAGTIVMWGERDGNGCGSLTGLTKNEGLMRTVDGWCRGAVPSPRFIALLFFCESSAYRNEAPSLR